MSIKKFPERAFALEMLIWLFLCSRFSSRFAPVGVRPPVGEAYDIAGKARAQVVNSGVRVAFSEIWFQNLLPSRAHANAEMKTPLAAPLRDYNPQSIGLQS